MGSDHNASLGRVVSPKPGKIRINPLEAVLALVFLILWPCLGMAATWTVNSNADASSGSGTSGTLRWVMENAQSWDIIQFDASLDGETITLGSALDAGAKNFSFKVASGTVTFAGAALQSTGTLTVPVGSGNLVFNSPVSFSGGIIAAPKSSANITLADYSGGRVLLGGELTADTWTGIFKGKLRIEGVTYSSSNNRTGGALKAWHSEPLSILDGTLIQNNSITVNRSTGTVVVQAYGGGAHISEADILAGTFTNNSVSATSSNHANAEARGAGASATDITNLSATVTNNTATATSSSDQNSAYTMGGGMRTFRVQNFTGTLSGNAALSFSSGVGGGAGATGGGIYASLIQNMQGTISGNRAVATVTSGSGTAGAAGGGITSNLTESITELSGSVTNNLAEAISITGGADATGGGLSLRRIASLTGTVSGNTARAFSDSGSAWAEGGGIATSWYTVSSLAGIVSGNTVEASNNSGVENATALGGGLFLYGQWTQSDPLVTTIIKGEYNNNKAVASGENARAEGGAIFLDTVRNSMHLVLDPSAGDISFTGNKVSLNGNEKANAVHFGRGQINEYFMDTYGDGELQLKDSAATGNLITIADGITTDINNGKAFTMTQTGGNFLWGGPNFFDSSGGDTVNLTGGTTRLMNGFTLDRGTVNGGTGLLAMSVTGGHLKSEGTAASLKNTALSVASGGKITVDLGSTLTLDASSTFSLNNGTLSFGVGNGGNSGVIRSLNTNTAPVFTGSNTLDISDWIPGTYVVLGADAQMAEGAAATFTTFTIGGNAIDADAYKLTVALNDQRYDLLVTAALNQGSKEKVWGGTSDTWNYTNQKWGADNSQKFVLGDLALFDGTNAGGAGLAVTVGGTQIETSGMRITGGSYTFSGGKIVGRTDISQGTDITPTGQLSIAGSGNIVFNNAVEFTEGVRATEGLFTGSLTLADYTGGRVYFISSGAFSGKVHVENQIYHNYDIGGGLFVGTGEAAAIREGSLIKNNAAIANANNDQLLTAFGGGLYLNGSTIHVDGEISGNRASATNAGTGNTMSLGGGIYSTNIVENFSATVSGNRSEAASAGNGKAEASGGGAFFGVIDTFSGQVTGNTTSASTVDGTALAVGGGFAGDGVITLSGDVSGNTATASASGGAGRAYALGGGASFSESSTITKGEYTNNQAVATGGYAVAMGGAIFMNSWASGGALSLTLDPTAGAITFSGNAATTKANAGDTGITLANAIHFGYHSTGNTANRNSILKIQDSTATGNLITIADGITTDINNGKTFTMAQTGGNLLWGGPNLFDSSGGDTVNLTGGTTRLMNGFSLDRGTVNGGTGLLAFNVTGGHLRSEGTAASLKNTALAVSSGGKFTVDLGSTLALDAASTFSLNNGTLSFGVGEGNASGVIRSLNTNTAPVFTGSNTLDISTWIPGTYVVLGADAQMDAGAAASFTNFTVGGNAIDAEAYKLTVALNDQRYDLLVTAALNQDSKQKTWGGSSGTWNYTNTNWLPGTSRFVLGDLALFDGTGAGGAGLAVTVGGTQIETAGMRITDGSYTFSGGKIVGKTGISEGNDITPTGQLSIAGSGNIVFNNAVDFVNGITVAEDSSANITLTDYTGGQIFVSSGYSGHFSGKLNIQGLNMSAGLTNFIGGAVALKYGGTLDVQAGSLFQDNTMTGSGTIVSINGGVIYADTISAFSGTVKNNTVTATGSSAYGGIYGGGVYAGSMGMFSGTVEGNNATATGTTNAHVYGGGVHAGTGGIAALSGKITDNTARASSADAKALGGGLYASGDVYVSGGSYSNNQAIATGTGARAEGGAIFMNTFFTPEAKLVLDPTTGAITFSGNKTVVNGVETPNAIHFGALQQSDVDTSLTIRDSAATANLITIADGVTTDLNNGKTFTMTQTGGTLLWGGANVFDASGGSTVSLTGGETRLMNGFSLDRGTANGGTGLLAFNITGGHLKSEGTAASLKNTALALSSGGKLTVDLGSTLSLDENSTFSLDGGILSFGVGSGNNSGKIVSQNIVTAPTFRGSNTLDISQWTLGDYTVLESALAMDVEAPDTFSTFTVGGNALGSSVFITPSLSGDGKSLIVTASLSRDNLEVTWGGVSGSWNYTDALWLRAGSSSIFLPEDAALFTCASPQNITLTGTSISLSGMRVTGDSNHTLTGAALHIDASSAQNLTDPGYLNKLQKESAGTLLLQTGSASNPNLIAGDLVVTNGILALGEGFVLNHTGAGGFFSINAGMNTPILDVRGAAAINDMSLQVVAGASELRFTRPGSSLALNTVQTSYLGSGIMDVDLNRSKTLAALSVTGGGTLSLDQSTLRVRHTGLVSDSGSWLIIDGDYVDFEGNQNSGKSFETLDIATATLEGALRSETGQVFFDGTYTVIGGEFPNSTALTPNGRRAWIGFQDAFYHQRTPFMETLEQAYLSPTAFEADLPEILKHLSAEGPVSHGLFSMKSNKAIAVAALGQAFEKDGAASGISPFAFQRTLLGQHTRSDLFGNTQSPWNPAFGFEDMNSLPGTGGQVFSEGGHSLLANWTPAVSLTRNLVANASPEFLNLESGPNTSFGARVWGGYFGDFIRQDKKDGYSGYKADQHGFLVGFSYEINDQWTTGLYAGYTDGDIRYKDIHSKMDTESTHVGSFVRYEKDLGQGRLKTTGDMIYSRMDNESRRVVPTAAGAQSMKGDFDQNVWGLGLEVVYDKAFAHDSAMVLSPYISARYTNLEQDGFRERGNLALNVRGLDADSFTTSAGLRLARDFAVKDKVIVTPTAMIGWLHEWADTNVQTSSHILGSPVSFITKSVEEDRDAALIGLGVDVLIRRKKGWDLGFKASYGADLRENSDEHVVFAGLEMRF